MQLNCSSISFHFSNRAMNPIRDLTYSQMQAFRHLPGASEVMEAMRANKPPEEIMRIFLRYPGLMAAYIVSKDPFYSR